MGEQLCNSCGCDSPDIIQDLIPVDHAVRIARSLASPIKDDERIGLRKAFGRIVAQDLRAPRAMPFFDNSAMDGFAVRIEDLDKEGPWRLPVFGIVPAGTTLNAVEGGVGAYQIFTGAPLPHGYNAVIMQEQCNFDGRHLVFDAAPRKGENIRLRGEDITEGETLVSAGTVLDPRHIGLLAGNGFTTVDVRRKIRIAILSTGNELTRGGQLDGPAAIFDANAPMLEALCSGPLFDTRNIGVLSDDPAPMTEALRDMSGQYDLIISTGAASNGARDHLRAALEAARGRVAAHHVGLKPGKPVFFGRLGGAVYTGLPGNSLAAFVGFELFVKAQIEALAGLSSGCAAEGRAVLKDTVRRKPGRMEYVPARIADGPAERPVVELLGHGSSATLFPLSQADGLAVLPTESEKLEGGEVVAWLPFPYSTRALGV